jgi:hypothetical protein
VKFSNERCHSTRIAAVFGLVRLDLGQQDIHEVQAIIEGFSRVDFASVNIAKLSDLTRRCRLVY